MELKLLPHFFNNKVYTVPDYQRGYSWQAKNVTDLLTDIHNAIELSKAHYMGTISLHAQEEKVKVGLNNFTNYHVVDGQQRFTTLVLILSYLLKELSKNTETKQDAEEKIKSYLKNRESYVFRYAIDKISDDYFRSHILGLEQKSSADENLYTRNLLKAKETISEYFSKRNEPEVLLKYLNAIEEKLQFNEFILIEGNEIGVVFETMNNRGISLSNLEIVKNRLLYLTSKVPTTDETKSDLKELTDLINKKWSHILKNLTLPTKVLDENSFLSNHWIIYNGWTKDNLAKTEILDGYFTISQMIKNPKKIAEEIRRYIHSLAETSLVWRNINYPEEGTAFNQVKNNTLRDEIRHYLLKLNRLGGSTVRPLILAFYPLLTTKPDFLLELIKLAEIYTFRLFSMNKKRADTGKNDIYRVCNNFHVNCHENKIQQNALFYLAWYIDIHGDWRRFEVETEELFASNKKNGFYSWSGLSYFLYEYEENLRNGQPEKVEYKFASQAAKSVEHILPQTATNSYWKDALKDLSKGEKKKLTHSLGNLLLISRDKNSALRHSEYSIKKDEYKVGSYSENEIAKKYKEWGVEEIEKREASLMRFLKKRWRINEHFQDSYPHPDGTSELYDEEVIEEETL